MDHDQRLKKLVKRFFAEFMGLFFPAWAAKFDFDHVEWASTELFTTVPDGDRHLLDLVAKARLREPDPADPDAGASLVAVHIEIETADRTTRLGARMPSYYVHLRETHGLPVLPLVMYTQVGLEGLGRGTFAERVAGEVVAEFHYWYVGLPRLDAMAYLEGESLLGVALTPLMRMPADRAAQVGADATQRVATAEMPESDRTLLADCIKAYLPADEATERALEEILNRASYREAKAMGATWFEMGEKKGRQEGRLAAERNGLLTAISAVLEVKFGEAGLAFADELSGVADVGTLTAFLASSKKASSLDELKQLLH